MVVSLRTHIPERLLQLNRETRTVQATNMYKNLELYLYFNKPVMNSAAEISDSIHITQGSLLPIIGDSLGNRRFGFQVTLLINRLHVLCLSDIICAEFNVKFISAYLIPFPLSGA